MAFLKDSLKRVWFKILATTVYRRVLLLERTLDSRVPLISPRVDITIDCIDDARMTEYLRLQPEARESLIRDRFTRDHTCFAARHEGHLIAVAWATSHQIHMSPYVSFVTPLPDRSIYFYDSFTERGFRGLSIQTALCSHMMRYFNAKGFQRAVAGIVPENQSSLRKLQKCGFQPYEMIRCVKLGPYRWLLPVVSHSHDR